MKTDDVLAVMDVLLEDTHVAFIGPPDGTCATCGESLEAPCHPSWWEDKIHRITELWEPA